MSIAVLTQVYDETRRLAIAGSVVAGGDFRLKKLIAPLEQAGAKAPVFAKIGQAVKSLVESNEQTSALALLELSTLVNAVLYTQGETGLAGKIEPIETTDLGPQTTQASARVLKPLLEALSTTGSGRLEIIRDSFERGAFRDLRLVKPALNGIDDPYPEISQFIGKTVLPLFGKAILPELRAKFDIKGKAGHLRRLALMHHLDPEGTRETIKQALDEGSKEMKVVAIQCLGDAPEDLTYLLDQAKAKAKDVRAAALSALTRVDAPEAVEVLQKALAGSDLVLAVRPLRKNRNPKLLQYVLTEIETQIEAGLATKDKKESGKHADRITTLMQCLDERDDKLTEAFLLKTFARREALLAMKGEPSGLDINNRISELMIAASKKCQEALVAAHGSLSPECLVDALQAATRCMKPAAVFETFSPYLLAKVDEKKKGRDPAWSRRSELASSMSSPWMWRRSVVDDEDLDDFDDESDSLTPEGVTWDPRWLDVAIQIKSPELVQALARPGHAGCNEFLSESFAAELKKSKDLYDCGEFLATMVRVKHPQATDCLISVLKKHGKSKLVWGVYWISRLIPDLPKSAVKPLEELLPELSEKVVDELLEPINTLRNKPDE